MIKFILCISILIQISLSAQIGSLPDEPSNNSYGNIDWLIDASNYISGVYRTDNTNELVLTNGLVRRVFLLKGNAATISFDNLITNESVIRGIKPEGKIIINGESFNIGGLQGQPNYAYFNPEWIDSLRKDTSFSVKQPTAPFQWKKVRYVRKDMFWPPKGIHLQMNYKFPESKQNQKNKGILVSVHYELYDGLPVIVKWLAVKNILSTSF